MKLSPIHSTQAIKKHRRLAACWAILGALGMLAVFPYSTAIVQQSATSIPVSLPIIAIGTVQMGLVLFFLCWIGLRLGQSVGLDTPIARAMIYGMKPPAISRRAIAIALLTGIGGGFVLLGLIQLFEPFMPPMIQSTGLTIALWKRLLTAFYGGITEELLLRLFLMTLVTWIFWKVGMRGKGYPAPLVFWMAIAIAAIMFGVLHLPTAATVWVLTPIVIFRTLVLNSLLGIAFGYLYWQWGLEYAVLSHFCADLVLHAIAGN